MDINEINFERWGTAGRRKLQGQHVIPVVVSVPSKMLEEGQEKVDALKELLELRCSAIGGLHSGISIDLGEKDELLAVKSAKCEPWMEFPEREGDPVKGFLNEFTEKYVVGNTLNQLLEDGLVLAFIEPDPTYTVVIRTWILKGVAFQNTGLTEGRRNMGEKIQDQVYHVPLIFAKIDNDRDTNQFGQAWLNNCNRVDTDTKTGAVTVHANTTTD